MANRVPQTIPELYAAMTEKFDSAAARLGVMEAENKEVIIDQGFEAVDRRLDALERETRTLRDETNQGFIQVNHKFQEAAQS